MLEAKCPLFSLPASRENKSVVFTSSSLREISNGTPLYTEILKSMEMDLLFVQIFQKKTQKLISKTYVVLDIAKIYEAV